VLDIVAIAQTYNDFEGVKRLHSKLKEKGIFSIWGDGRYPDFEKINNSDLSSDETRDYLLAQDDIKLMYYPNMLEYDKLTKLLHTAGKMGFKYAILFGCDEYPIGDFKELVNNLNKLEDKPAVHRLKFTKKGKKDRQTHPFNYVERVFRYPGRISVKITHWRYHIDGKTELNVSDKKRIKGITIHHDQTIRPKEREYKMSEYQVKQFGNERSGFFAEAFGIDSNPTMRGLKKLFPNNEIIEHEKHFSIKGETNAKRLLFSWLRWRDFEELCVKKFS